MQRTGQRAGKDAVAPKRLRPVPEWLWRVSALPAGHENAPSRGLFKTGGRVVVKHTAGDSANHCGRSAHAGFELLATWKQAP